MGKTKILNLGLIVGLLISSVVFIGGCFPIEGEDQGDPWMTIVPLILIFVVFYFLMIRPQRKKQKEHQELIAELKRGDRVITAGGIYGVIESISEDNIVIKVESGATMRVAKGSVNLKRER